MLYACNSGLLRSILKSIAKFFDTNVIGFGVKIEYNLPFTPTKLLRATEEIGIKGTHYSDFHMLDSHSTAMREPPPP